MCLFMSPKLAQLACRKHLSLTSSCLLPLSVILLTHICVRKLLMSLFTAYCGRWQKKKERISSASSFAFHLLIYFHFLLSMITMSCRFHNKRDREKDSGVKKEGEKKMKNGSQFILMSLSNILLKRYKAIKINSILA